MHKIELRDYQKDIITRAIKSKGNILIQAPTGSGKTVIAEEIVKFHKESNKKTLFLAPKINLLEQTAKAFSNLNPQIIHGSNKEDIDTQAHSFVSTIQTISRRVDLEKDKFNIQKLDNKFVNNVERFLEIASENPELKMYVAANEYISLKLLKKFAKDKDENIRNIIQKNPNFTNRN